MRQADYGGCSKLRLSGSLTYQQCCQIGIISILYEEETLLHSFWRHAQGYLLHSPQEASGNVQVYSRYLG